MRHGSKPARSQSAWFHSHVWASLPASTLHPCLTVSNVSPNGQVAWAAPTFGQKILQPRHSQRCAHPCSTLISKSIAGSEPAMINALCFSAAPPRDVMTKQLPSKATHPRLHEHLTAMCADCCSTCAAHGDPHNS